VVSTVEHIRFTLIRPAVENQKIKCKGIVRVIIGKKLKKVKR
jgi:hypothetical protein